MNNRLFQESLHSFKEQKLREAIAGVEAIPKSILLDPTLDESLKEIVDHFQFVVATLRPDERVGRRRKEMRRTNHLGQVQDVEVSLIDVTIPFDGYPKSFTIAPSTCHVLQMPAKTNQDGLVATFYDDDNLDRNVDSFVKMVGENLDTLRKELNNFRSQIEKTAHDVANHRAEKLKAQIERDKGRSFRIE